MNQNDSRKVTNQLIQQFQMSWRDLDNMLRLILGIKKNDVIKLAQLLQDYANDKLTKDEYLLKAKQILEEQSLGI
ncbi:unnamed protein product [Adineta steineri]|uniref:Uncharacterized protein n=2 Tax=Adineta steineri TaxID=433720 RepID=A0A815U7C0_9BILA|nr:unnamed protein product [Adineta steineri]